jgi:hypothetical protein
MSFFSLFISEEFENQETQEAPGNLSQYEEWRRRWLDSRKGI